MNQSALVCQTHWPWLDQEISPCQVDASHMIDQTTDFQFVNVHMLAYASKNTVRRRNRWQVPCGKKEERFHLHCYYFDDVL